MLNEEWKIPYPMCIEKAIIILIGSETTKEESIWGNHECLGRGGWENRISFRGYQRTF